MTYAGKEWRITLQYYKGRERYVLSEEEAIARTERCGYCRKGEAITILKAEKEFRLPNAILRLEEIRPEAKRRSIIRDPKPEKPPARDAQVSGQTSLFAQ